MKVDIQDFIGVFDDMLEPDYCNDVIKHFEYIQSINLTSDRQSSENVERYMKEDSTYFTHDEMIDEHRLSNTHILRRANIAITQCLNEYFNRYDTLNSINYGVYSYRIQRTKPGEGYHIFHNERGNLENANRFLSFIIYLNDVEDGGETEFLYYPRRVKPKAGRILVFPADFTHTHRGNQPLTNDKYIITTWANYTK